MAGWAAFRIRDFRCFFGSRFLHDFAMQIQTVGIGWFVYERTNSALALGLAGLAAFLPALALALVSGHVADNYDRRIIAASCHLATACASAGLVLERR